MQSMWSGTRLDRCPGPFELQAITPSQGGDGRPCMPLGSLLTYGHDLLYEMEPAVLRRIAGCKGRVAGDCSAEVPGLKEKTVIRALLRWS
jgi:hypothetical protein